MSEHNRIVRNDASGEDKPFSSPISQTWMLIMRNSAFLSLSAALLFAVTPVAAQNDFDALLSDLTFSDSPASSQTLTLDVAAEKAIQALQPAPAESSHAITMPPPSAAVNAAQAPFSVPAPQQVYHAPAETSQVDFGAAFAAQDCDSCTGGGCDAGGCGSGSSFGGCGNGSTCPTCIPYHRPSLPSSSFYGAFRSDPCNVDVWNGFRNRCHFASKHSRGECDCFSNNGGCGGCETPVYEAQACEPRVCSVPSITRTKRFFDFSKKSVCDGPEEVCDRVVPSCDSAGGTCD